MRWLPQIPYTIEETDTYSCTYKSYKYANHCYHILFVVIEAHKINSPPGKDATWNNYAFSDTSGEIPVFAIWFREQISTFGDKCHISSALHILCYFSLMHIQIQVRAI